MDTIGYVPEPPLPYADSYLIDSGIRARAGQTGVFVPLRLAALGLRTHHLDFTDDDPGGDLVRAPYHVKGIGLTAIPQLAGSKRAGNLVARTAAACPCTTPVAGARTLRTATGYRLPARRSAPSAWTRARAPRPSPTTRS